MAPNMRPGGMRPAGLLAAAIASALFCLPNASAQEFGRWCGKFYNVGAPMPNSRPAGSLFPYPQLSASPLLDFQCATASSLYLQGDEANDAPMILIDTNITHDVGQPYSGPTSSCTTLQVDVYQGSNHVASGAVPVNKLGTLLPLNLSALAPQQASYGLSCTATLGASNQTTFATNASLLYLPPNPYGGNTVKVDRRSGALLVRNETAGAKAWEKLIPFGFYDSYNSTSDPAIYGPGYGTDARKDTLSRLYLAKQLGFNLVHPVPPGGYMPYTFDAEATAQFNQYVDTAASLGLYIQYDMRNSFLNLSSVQYQVEYLRNRSNILSWYTGDEPDGADYDLNSTQLAYDLIYQIDGYRPVSLVLNCENYYFIDYGLNGADLVMVDPYPIAMNARWSKPYNTYVDENFGDSGCDNCNGTFYDISTRIDSTRNRARLQGAWRTKPAWIVPQSFNDGQEEFWYRVPTGSEGEAVTNFLAWNHGAQGSASWNSQYSSADLLHNASVIASILYNQSRFLVDHYDSRQQTLSNLSYPGINGYDLAAWTIPAAETPDNSTKAEVLVFAVNQNYGPNDAGPSWAPPFTLAEDMGTVKTVLYGSVSAGEDGKPVFALPRTSVAAVILEK